MKNQEQRPGFWDIHPMISLTKIAEDCYRVVHEKGIVEFEDAGKGKVRFETLASHMALKFVGF